MMDTEYQASGQAVGIGNSEYPPSQLASGRSTWPSRLVQSDWLWGLAAVLLPLAYLLMYLDRGVALHDTGQLCQAASRVLEGQVPHRDFQESYTGLLTLLNAGALQILGDRAMSLRLAMLPMFCVFCGVFYCIARRWLARATAVGLTLLATIWSVPNYPEAMPSWYNLFLAGVGIWCLIRARETALDKTRWAWIFAAGMCGGLSLLFKISGLYFLLAALMWLVYDTCQASQLAAAGSNSQASRDNASLGTATIPRRFCWARFATRGIGLGCGLCVCAVAVLLLRGNRPAATFYHLALPLLGLAVLVVSAAWQAPSIKPRDFGRLILSGAVLAVGAAVTCVPFLVYFYREAALADLYGGVFVAPRQRLDFAALPFPPVSQSGFAVPMALVIAIPAALRLWRQATGRRKRDVNQGYPASSRATRVGLAMVAGACVATWLGGNDSFYFATGQMIRHLNPLLALCVVGLILSRDALAGGWIRAGGSAVLGQDSAEAADRSLLFLLTAASVWISVVQYPFAAPVYALYAFPLTLLVASRLLTLSFVGSQTSPPRRVVAVDCGTVREGSIANLLPLPAWCLAGFLLVFGSLYYNRTLTCNIELGYRPLATESLQLMRCNYRFATSETELYSQLIREVSQRAPAGATILATPDAPEVYYLSGCRNPLPHFYEFFDPGWFERLERLEQILIEENPALVIEKVAAPFSAGLTDEVRDRISDRYTEKLVFVDPRDTDRVRYILYAKARNSGEP